MNSIYNVIKNTRSAPPVLVRRAMATGGLPGVTDTLETESDEKLREAATHICAEKSLSIFTYGKTGSGKSSLVGDILDPKALRRPEVQAGMEPVTNETRVYEIAIPNAKGLSVKVCDTRGMLDLHVVEDEDEKDDETLRFVGDVCLNDVNGVLLICIPMHERIDRSTLDLLALLHKEHHEKGIWRFVVIALTKADEYPETEWLKMKKTWTLITSPFLTQKFDEAFSSAKATLKRIFTSKKHKICMSEEEFSGIPILPTSQLYNKSALSKMECVGKESWFDALLLECCKREQGRHLVTIHQRRLTHLVPKRLDEAGFPASVGPRIVPYIRHAMETEVGHIALIGAWKIYWYLAYSKQLVTSPRFQQDRREEISTSGSHHASADSD